MTKKINVAIVGVNNAVGEVILTLLEERKFPLGECFLVDDSETAGNKLQLNGKYHTVRLLEDFDFSSVNLALFVVRDELSAEYVPKAADAGCVVIDSSSQFRQDADVPLVVAGVNSETIDCYRARNIIAMPAPMTSIMLMAIKPLYDAVGITRINVLACEAVSDLGKDAVEELASQTMALLSMQKVKQKVFAQQIAFNVLPQIGGTENDGSSAEESKMHHESRKILADADILINPTVVQVPVFFGHSAALHIETRDKLDVATASKLLKRTSGITVRGESKTAGLPTAVSHATGSDTVWVSRIRADHTHPRGLNLWVVADNVRRGVALNSVQIAEFLVKESV